uniref:Uncharacterized protein n=1 Tax=Lygus hesperus TaxID=30085 RepID=A0A0K8SS09_LYGHE
MKAVVGELEIEFGQCAGNPPAYESMDTLIHDTRLLYSRPQTASWTQSMRCIPPAIPSLLLFVFCKSQMIFVSGGSLLIIACGLVIDWMLGDIVITVEMEGSAGPLVNFLVPFYTYFVPHP